MDGVSLAGLGLGLAIAGVVYLKDHRLDVQPNSPGKPVKKKFHGDDAPRGGRCGF